MSFQNFFESLSVRQAVLGFTGWSDAGNVVRQILGILRKTFTSELVGSWDLDGFWHTESARPRVSIRHGHIQQLDWPSYHFHTVMPLGGEPVLLGIGVEPSLRWRTFAHELLEQLRRWQCEEVILLGSLYDQIFYDEVVISGVAQDTHGFNLLRELGCQRVEYEGPSAIHSAIIEAAPLLGIRPLSLWAHVPFYLKTPHELVMAHYLRMVGQLLGMELSIHHLMKKWQERLEEIENLIREDAELQQLIRDLEGKEPSRTYRPDPSSKVIQMDEFLRRRHDPSIEDE